MSHADGIEYVWAMMKHGFNGTYHHWSVQHCDRYVNAFAGRHNAHPMDTADQVTALAKGTDGRRLPYQELVG